MRVVIADDHLLVREGIASPLRRAGFDVVRQASTAAELMREAEAHGPDDAIVDVRIPHTYTDERLRAAQEVRADHPRVGS